MDKLLAIFFLLVGGGATFYVLYKAFLSIIKPKV